MRVGSSDCLITPPGQSARHGCRMWSRFIEGNKVVSHKEGLHFLPLLLSLNLICFIGIYVQCSAASPPIRSGRLHELI